MGSDGGRQMNIIVDESIQAFRNHLYLNEKSKATVMKYTTVVRRLAEHLAGKELTKLRLLQYREYLQNGHKAQTVNGNLTAIHSFLDFCGWEGIKVKLLKIQRRVFLDESKELSTAEYKRLLATAQARHNNRLYMLMLTLCGTGIRIGELRYITVEAAQAGRAEISLKGKNRTIILQKELCGRLMRYARARGIESGMIFCTRSGRPLDRSNVCHDMKQLCEEAKVDSSKVFPHSFRHLFARTFYAAEKNLAHLADVLGHSRIETTRIYVAVSASTQERILSRMNLII